MSFLSLQSKFSKIGSVSKFQDIPVGSSVRATLKIEEGEKSRNQVFEGLLIKKKKSRGTTSITLRKVSFGVGVERIIPLDSTALVNLEVTSQHHVRRSKLYFLRRLTGKASKLQELYGARKQDLSYLDSELGPAATAAPTTAAAASAPEPQDAAAAQPQAKSTATELKKPKKPKEPKKEEKEKPKQ